MIKTTEPSLIWRYDVQLRSPTGLHPITMPRLGRILTVAPSDREPDGVALWIITPAALASDKVDRFFEIHGTGHPIPAGRIYVGTWQVQPCASHVQAFVWHLFEIDPSLARAAAIDHAQRAAADERA